MKQFLISNLLLFSLFSCEKLVTLPVSTYACELSRPGAGNEHPLSADFSRLLDGAVPFTTGIQLAITDAQGNTWSGSRGFTDIGNGIPVENCHRFMIASISKPVTAVMVLQLVEEGRLDLDALLVDYLSNEIIRDLANADQATIQQLLNHTSGIPDYLTQKQTLNAQNTPFLKETQMEKLRYARGLEPIHPLGTAFSYSNTNYLLLGLVVSVLRDKPLWEVVDDAFSLPLGLDRFAMGTEEDPIPSDVVRPYLAFTGGKFIDVTPTAVADAATGDGGIASNMLDLNLWAQALFSGNLIEQTTLNRMINNTQATGEGSDFPEWPEESYGLGISRYNTPFGLAYGHTGSTSAYNSILLYYPDSGVSFSVIISGVDLEKVDETEDKIKGIRDEVLSLLLP